MNPKYIYYYKKKIIKIRKQLIYNISCYDNQNKFTHKQKLLLKKFNYLQDNYGNTLLHTAVLHNNKRIIKYLLKNNADKYIKNYYGLYPKDLTNNKEILDLFNKY